MYTTTVVYAMGNTPGVCLQKLSRHHPLACGGYAITAIDSTIAGRDSKGVHSAGPTRTDPTERRCSTVATLGSGGEEEEEEKEDEDQVMKGRKD